MASENLDIIDITLLLRLKDVAENVTEELDTPSIEHLYYCEVEVIREDNKDDYSIVVNRP